MKKETLLGTSIITLILLGIIFYSATKPSPVKAPTESKDVSSLSGTSFVEHATYYDIAVNYASSTPLKGASNAQAVTLMKQFVADTIAQFKTDGNFDNLTAEDVKMLGFSDGRKEALQISYMIATSPRTVSYIFTTYANTFGAHPNTYFHTFTFDTTTGAHLPLTDIFIVNTDYLSKLSEISRAKLPGIIGQDVANTTTIAAGTTSNEENFSNFFFDNQDIVFLFDPYQVAAYAAGPQTLRTPRSEFSSVLKPEYR